MSIAARLAELGVTLPDAPAPAANYVPAVRSGDLLFVSGQISSGPDGLITGRLGDGMSVEDGAAAARACAISLLAQVQGGLRRRHRAAGAGRQADRLRQLHARFHRSAQGHQRRVGFPGRGAGRRGPSYPLGRGRRRCRSASRSRSRASSGSDDDSCPARRLPARPYRAPRSADSATARPKTRWPRSAPRSTSASAIELDVQPSPTGWRWSFHDYDSGPADGRARAGSRAHRGRALGSIALLGADDGIPRLADVLTTGGGPRAAADRDQGPRRRHGAATSGRWRRAVIADAGRLCGRRGGDVVQPAFGRLHSATTRPHLPRGLVTCGLRRRRTGRPAGRDPRPPARRSRISTASARGFVSHQADALDMPRGRRAQGAGRADPVLDDPLARQAGGAGAAHRRRRDVRGLLALTARGPMSAA